MKSVFVKTKNFALKEKLLVDLATLGYRILITNDESPEIIVTDYPELTTLGNDDLKKVVLVVIDGGDFDSSGVLERVDDVMFNPYTAIELELRIKLALIKHGGYETKEVDELAEKVLTVDGMTVNFDSYEVSIDGEPLDLTFKEYELLKCLITNRGRVYTRDQLLSIIWGYDYYGGARTVDVHVRRLRSKLGGHESLIETVRNVGYRFKR
ncbi:MAG TPA: response regulator transcription factor [Candidatus Aquicultor sp.]|jgi:DNA-binding response OmpR family regulator